MDSQHPAAMGDNSAQAPLDASTETTTAIGDIGGDPQPASSDSNNNSNESSVRFDLTHPNITHRRRQAPEGPRIQRTRSEPRAVSNVYYRNGQPYLAPGAHDAYRSDAPLENQFETGDVDDDNITEIQSLDEGATARLANPMGESSTTAHAGHNSPIVPPIASRTRAQASSSNAAPPGDQAEESWVTAPAHAVIRHQPPNSTPVEPTLPQMFDM